MADRTFDEELADHLETWGPNCGAPKRVYEGHLRKLLAAHREQVQRETAAALRAENERLKAALKPFGALAPLLDRDDSYVILACVRGSKEATVSMGDFRRAAEALEVKNA